MNEEKTKEEYEEVPEPEPEIEPRLARPDEHYTSDKPREKSVIWVFNDEKLLSKVQYKEVSWSTFADLMFECTDDDDNFNVKKYLIQAGQQIIISINDEMTDAKSPYKWRHEFGLALISHGIIPKPSFGGDGAKNQ